MRPQFTTQITSLEEAREFLTYLHEQGLSYHPDDQASDCIGHLVTPQEAEEIEARMEEVHDQAWPEGEDPCSHILNLDPEYRARQQEEAAEEAAKPTMKYQVLYEDPADGWMPTNLGIFLNADEAKETAKYWLEGYATRGNGTTRLALQEIKPRQLPEGATEI
jgi:hypothetical protein